MAFLLLESFVIHATSSGVVGAKKKELGDVGSQLVEFQC